MTMDTLQIWFVAYPPEGAVCAAKEQNTTSICFAVIITVQPSEMRVL